MQMRTLPRRRRAGGAGWSHPYPIHPFSAIFYADGGGGDGSESGSGGSDDGGSGGDGGGDGAAGDGGDGAGTGDQGGSEGEKPKPKPPAGKKDGDGDEDPAAKIQRLEKDLKNANAEAAKARTGAKQQAADEARNEIVQELGKVLGLVEDEKDKAPDPAALKAHLESAQKAHRETAIELAVFRSAGKHGADPEALTDSRAFLRSIAELDPSDEKFASKVSDAIKAAVTDNPKLKAAGQAPARGSGDFSGGTEKPKKTDSIDAHRKARREARSG